MIGRVLLSRAPLAVYDGEWHTIHLSPGVLCLVVGSKAVSQFGWLHVLLPSLQLVWLYEHDVEEGHLEVVK